MLLVLNKANPGHVMQAMKLTLFQRRIQYYILIISIVVITVSVTREPVLTVSKNWPSLRLDLDLQIYLQSYTLNVYIL